ncbi:HD domain-containing protein [Viridibacterium curvum]|uniref:HD domain-containing protein n=1 Tax=Viridibacterium curvum TaxID=1101404 RepID=A0ABP9Q687_9RHOO
MNQRLTIEDIQAVFERQGATWYGDEAVSQLEHALQCAQLAEQAGEPPSLILAALLHDLGHLLIQESMSEDRRHQDIPGPFIDWLGEAVIEPIRLHVAAKRYLCAVDPAYHASLSPASQHTLALQGGIYNTAEATAFAALSFAQEAMRLRRYDDLAKVPGLPTPPLAHFLRHAREMANAA